MIKLKEMYVKLLFSLIGLSTTAASLYYLHPYPLTILSTLSGTFTFFYLFLSFLEDITTNKKKFEEYWEQNKPLLRSLTPYELTKRVYNDIL